MFFVSRSQDDFNAKYTALFWPNKIEEQVAQTEDNLLADEERFRTLQQTDQASFQEKIDSLQVCLKDATFQGGIGLLSTAILSHTGRGL